MERTNFSVTGRALCFALSIPSVVTAICGIDAFFVRLGASDSDYAEDPERSQMGSGCNGAFEQSSSVDTLTGGAGKLGCRSFVDVRVSFGRNWVSAEDSRHAGIPGTCLNVFLHKKRRA